MFYAVILIESRERLVLPQKWVNIGGKMKSGIPKGSTKYTVFHSTDGGIVPDFKRPIICDGYDANSDSYYLANILYIFGM